MIHRSLLLLTLIWIVWAAPPASAQPWHGLAFDQLATTWDEAVPLGNGLIGALIWQKQNRLRFSLDRADLWDLRPVAEFSLRQFTYSWIADQVRKGVYDSVQALGDRPYDRDVAPTRIPGAGLEFPIASLGRVISVRLTVDSALCLIQWNSGARCLAFVHATLPVGWYRFEHLPEGIEPEIQAPPYRGPTTQGQGTNPTVQGQDLQRLGYGPPSLSRGRSAIEYSQSGFGGFHYTVATRWEKEDAGTLTGVWAISASPGYSHSARSASEECARALARGMAIDLRSHLQWWSDYWHRSTIRLPDSLLERQWYLDTYKFGAASRRGAPPITLQAVWTADNGKLPPWRGDYHNDLNTELSYWPCYSGNRLEEGLAFLDWLWKCRPAARRYTREFFGVNGLNFPGVATLLGDPMGGWVQYSCSPTVSAWLAHHFYWYWRYSGDRRFLRERAYPWICESARFLENISIPDGQGNRQLPLSSSPEIHDNRIDAWFLRTTNYDLALIRWLFTAASELADELGRPDEASHWRVALSGWPELARSEANGALLVAPGIPLKESHRHFSPLLGIFPLGLVDGANGERDRQTINTSLADLERLGSDWWCGYSYAWLGSLQARAQKGEEAARALRTFAECFVLKNSFHANGDQSGSGKSKFVYRPFTLEGNFAFAEGVQEMLLQSQGRRVVIFPAIPKSWKDVSFTTLRAEGGFLLSATMMNGLVREVKINSKYGGTLKLRNPFGPGRWRASGIPDSRIVSRDPWIIVDCSERQEFALLRSE